MAKGKKLSRRRGRSSSLEQPRFEIARSVAWDYLEWTSVWQELAQKADAVCFGSLAQRAPTSRALILHVAPLTGGIGGEIAAIIAQEAFEYLDGPITRLAAPDVPAMPFSHTMQDFFMPNADKIAEALRKRARTRPSR